jgi:hypothetical protein
MRKKHSANPNSQHYPFHAEFHLKPLYDMGALSDLRAPLIVTILDRTIGTID